MRRFHFSDGSSNKFWQIERQGTRLTVQFGRLGTAGQTQIKDLADEAAAQKEQDKLIAEKVKKGYTDATAAPGAGPAPTPAAKPTGKKATAAAPGVATGVAPLAAAGATSVPAAVGAKRIFEYVDASSHKFWAIERSGTALTIQYGRVGSAGQTQLKSCASEEAARKEHDKLVAEKVGKGYRETTPGSKAAPGSMREALEQALVENPDDLASHMAFADYLSEQGDPLGEFIRLQLELEDASRTPDERKKLQQQERKLLNRHQDAWFGELAPLLFAKPKKNPDYGEPQVNCTVRRGWIDSIEVVSYGVSLTRLLAKSPQLRLLRRLALSHNLYEEPGEFPAGPDIPEAVEFPQLYPLIRSEYLRNVRQLTIGEVPTAKDEDLAHEGAFNCNTQADGVVGLVKQMPRLEELRLFAHNVDTKQLFALKTLNNLRVLQVYHEQEYPLAALSKNPSLGKLTHLQLHPHAMEDEHAFIRTAGIKAVVTSPTLSSLRHLALRMSDAGDKGIKEVIASGILKRLKVLDLRHGCVTDEGARLLAACGDAKQLELIDLYNNNITAVGIAALAAAGINADVRTQWVAGEEGDWGDSELSYLFAGDIE